MIRLLPSRVSRSGPRLPRSPARECRDRSPPLRVFAPFCILILLHAFIFTAAPARAHDPFEAFHTAVLRPDRLDLIITMAQATALKLITPTSPTTSAPDISSLTPDNLPAHRPRLLREAATLFIVTSVRTALTPRAIAVELTDENDLVFRLTYPRPAPGPLYFSAAYLKKLGDGYGGILELTDHTDKNLGWEQLLWSRPNFEIAIPK